MVFHPEDCCGVRRHWGRLWFLEGRCGVRPRVLGTGWAWGIGKFRWFGPAQGPEQGNRTGSQEKGQEKPFHAVEPTLRGAALATISPFLRAAGLIHSAVRTLAGLMEWSPGVPAKPYVPQRKHPT